MSTTLKIQGGDIVVDNISGRPAMISDHEVVKQHVAENLSIERLDNGFGAGLDQLVGSVYDQASMILLVNERIRASFRAMQSLQRSTLGPLRSVNERLSDVRNIIIMQSPTDPRVYRYRVDLLTEGGRAMIIKGMLGD